MSRMGQAMQWVIENDLDGDPKALLKYLEYRDGLNQELVSNCCSVPVIRETDYCSKCLEHCEIVNLNSSYESRSDQ